MATTEKRASTRTPSGSAAGPPARRQSSAKPTRWRSPPTHTIAPS